jgi:outer membrane protein
MYLFSGIYKFQGVVQSKLKMTALSIAAMVCSMSSLAQPPEQDGWEFGLGIAGMTSQKPYKDIDRTTMAIPVIQAENKYIRLFGPTLDFKLPSLHLGESQELNFNLSAEYDFGAYDKDDIKDTPILNGMQQRKGGVWAGAKVEWKNDIVDINAAWLADVSGKSKGQRASLGLEKTFHVGERVMLTPYVTGTFLDKKYVDYTYGVRQHEARPDRPEYHGDSAFQVEYGARGMYLFDMKNSMFIDVAVTSLSDEIKDSPIVDSAMENRIMLGYLYRF